MRKVYNPEDYVGKKLWSWTVTGTTEERTIDNRKMVTCLCECGSVRNVNLKNLIAGISKSCGCKLREKTSKLFAVDEVGNTYGKLTVEKRYGIDADGKATWDCICECGNNVIAVGRDLRNGSISACHDCNIKKRSRSRSKDYDGARFGRLTVVGRNAESYSKLDCICDCGVRTSVALSSLLRGLTQSCGCFRVERFNDPETRIKISASSQGVPLSDWDGFSRSKHVRERFTVAYKEWRESVFDRDDYTCQRCDKRSRSGEPVKLNAHHIFNFKSHPDLRLDVNNGITLCYECHSQKVDGSFHNIYNNRDNNPEQLEEYITKYRKEHGLTSYKCNFNANNIEVKID